MRSEGPMRVKHYLKIGMAMNRVGFEEKKILVTSWETSTARK